MNSTGNSSFTFDDFDSEQCFVELKKEVAFSLALLVGIIQVRLTAENGYLFYEVKIFRFSANLFSSSRPPI